MQAKGNPRHSMAARRQKQRSDTELIAAAVADPAWPFASDSLFYFHVTVLHSEWIYSFGRERNRTPTGSSCSDSVGLSDGALAAGLNNRKGGGACNGPSNAESASTQAYKPHSFFKVRHLFVSVMEETLRNSFRVIV